MSEARDVLGASVDRLRALVEPLTPAQRRMQAYPSEWTVADVLSHLGSGAVIHAARIDEARGGPTVDPQPIWDEWNAKDPDAKTAGALAADRALIERIDAMTDEERSSFVFEMGPLTFDFDGFLRLRLNEHTLHSWDIAVTLDPAAALAPDAVPLVLAAVTMIAAFAGRPTGSTRQVAVRTTAPERAFAVNLSASGVNVEPGDAAGPADLVLPVEALIRLVYGRLDPDHTPPFEGDPADLDELRRAFPGV